MTKIEFLKCTYCSKDLDFKDRVWCAKVDERICVDCIEEQDLEMLSRTGMR